MPVIRKNADDSEGPWGKSGLELNFLLEEWKEARKSIDRFDNISSDLRKYGLSVIAFILSTSSVVVDATKVQNPLPLVIVPIAVAILTLSVFLADSYYQVMLLATVLHARQLENTHKESLSQEGKGQIYYGLNLTNAVIEKTEKNHAPLYVFFVYLLFLAISFSLGILSLFAYHTHANALNLTPYILSFIGSYLVILLFILLISRGVNNLTREMQKTELIDNRFVIRKVFEPVEVTKATKQIAGRIYNMYRNSNLKILTLGMGGLYFAEKLISELKRQHNKVNVELISSFSERNKETVTIVPPANINIKNQDILIVDDLVSSGLTLNAAVEIYRGMGARSIRICVLLDAYNKRHPTAADLQLDLVGLKSPEKKLFFVGSGMDGGEKMSAESADNCRALPYIGVIVAP